MPKGAKAAVAAMGGAAVFTGLALAASRLGQATASMAASRGSTMVGGQRRRRVNFKTESWLTHYAASRDLVTGRSP